MSVTAQSTPLLSQIGPWRIRLANAADGPGLQALFAGAPLPGAIQLAFERPDPWAMSQLQCETPRVWVASDPASGRIVASYACGTRLVWVKGQRQTVPYLSDLRITPGARGGLLLARGFQHLRATELPPTAYAQTLILRQNTPAMALLTSGRAGLPGYYATGDYDHLALPVGQRVAGAWAGVRLATAADLPAIQALYDQEGPKRQFRPVYEFSQLGTPYFQGLSLADGYCAWQGQTLLGFAWLWDLRAIRRTRIHAYAPWLAALRPVYNLAWGRWQGLPLPPAGSALREAGIFALTCRDDAPATARALLAALLAAAATRGLDLLHLGLAPDDPLRPAVSGLRQRNFPGRHYLVSHGPDPRAGLDGRPLYFEAARI